jgi:hypothetical protein
VSLSKIPDGRLVSWLPPNHLQKHRRIVSVARPRPGAPALEPPQDDDDGRPTARSLEPSRQRDTPHTCLNHDIQHSGLPTAHSRSLSDPTSTTINQSIISQSPEPFIQSSIATTTPPTSSTHSKTRDGTLSAPRNHRLLVTSIPQARHRIYTPYYGTNTTHNEVRAVSLSKIPDGRLVSWLLPNHLPEHRRIVSVAT